jgi:hypothetical protein
MKGSRIPSAAALVERAPALSPLARTKLLFALAAGLSFAVSVALWFGGDRERGLFVGLWVPSILCAGNLLLVGEERRR